MTKRVGYIGLGNMGGALAAHLISGAGVWVYDLNPEKRAEFSAKGAKVCDSAAELVERCDVVFLCLPTTLHVESLLFGLDGVAAIAKPGTIFIDQTSGEPIKAKALAVRLQELSLRLVDAPVSGGLEMAHNGTIAILIGATAEDYAQVAPILGQISPALFHLGPVGSGYIAKACNNLMFSALRMISLEIMALASKNGVDPNTLCAAMSAGSAQSFFLDHTMKGKILTGQLHSGFTLGLAHKDVRQATDLAGHSAVPMLMGNVVRDFYQICIGAMGADVQVNEVARMVESFSQTAFIPR